MNAYYLLVIASGIISGFIVFGGQVLARLGFSLFEISIIPYLLPLAVLAPIWFYNRKDFKKEFIPLMLLYGAVETGIVFCQFAAPFFGATVTTTLLLLYVQPLWTILATILFLKEKITFVNILACILVLAGVVVLVGPSEIVSLKLNFGFLIALLGGIFLSGWVSVGSHLSKSGVKPIHTMFIGSSLMVMALSVLFPLARNFKIEKDILNFDFHKSAIAFAAIIIFGLITFLVNHYVYLKGTQKVPTADASVIMLLEPVVGAILAIIFLNERFTTNTIIAAILILLANYLVIAKPKIFQKR
jgi:drug/metabolite transporter (DMT)-like permease